MIDLSVFFPCDEVNTVFSTNYPTNLLVYLPLKEFELLNVFLLGSYLELENHGDTEVRWHLSSLAPPYVKVSNNCLRYTHFNV